MGDGRWAMGDGRWAMGDGLGWDGRMTTRVLRYKLQITTLYKGTTEQERKGEEQKERWNDLPTDPMSAYDKGKKKREKKNRKKREKKNRKKNRKKKSRSREQGKT